MTTAKTNRNLLNILGPGLLFASAAIGTSHLVLSTRAGAHHGMIFLGIILITLLLKYPFYEFGPRYAAATGRSLVHGYLKQGKWAASLFLAVIFINMFAVTGAVSAVCAGLLSTMGQIDNLPMPSLAAIIMTITVLMLMLGGYKTLDSFIKLVSLVLLVTVGTAFVAVLNQGPVTPSIDFQSSTILKGAGLALLVGLIGWMPAGMEASTMNSIWVVEKIKATGYHPSVKESLFDFKLGYGFTTLLAIMFMTIGAFTVYGSGQLLDGNSTQFANKLLNVFVSNLGGWSYWVIAIAAFGTIYGTFITVLDAFSRSFSRTVMAIKAGGEVFDDQQQIQLDFYYKILLIAICIGGFCLFYFFTGNMIKILEFATIVAFITAPIVSYLNLKSITSDEVADKYQPSKLVLYLAFLGLTVSSCFAFYYLFFVVLN